MRLICGFLDGNGGRFLYDSYYGSWLLFMMYYDCVGGS